MSINNGIHHTSARQDCTVLTSPRHNLQAKNRVSFNPHALQCLTFDRLTSRFFENKDVATSVSHQNQVSLSQRERQGDFWENLRAFRRANLRNKNKLVNTIVEIRNELYSG